MPKQVKITNLNKSNSINLDKISSVLDLEKKYFFYLWELFTSGEFINDLLSIEKEIILNYNYLNRYWNSKNKLKIPAERLVRHHIYKSKFFNVQKIYPSPLSSDIALIMDDVIINIDIKTVDFVGNKGDINYLQFLLNQSSFKNKKYSPDKSVPNSGIYIETSLPVEFKINNKELPILTYFLTIVYEDNGDNFKLTRRKEIPSINLKCLPSGLLSELFDNDIISNLKSYKYFGEDDDYKPIEIYNNHSDNIESLTEFINDNKDYKIVRIKNKIGLFNPDQKHPVYNKKGITWVPVKRKNNKLKLEAIDSPGAIRVSPSVLKNRYDSKDIFWEGDKNYFL